MGKILPDSVSMNCWSLLGLTILVNLVCQ